MSVTESTADVVPSLNNPESSSYFSFPAIDTDVKHDSLNDDIVSSSNICTQTIHNDPSPSFYSNISSNISYSDGDKVSTINSISSEKKKNMDIKLKKVKEAFKRLSQKQKDINPRYRVDNPTALWPKGTTLIAGDSILQSVNKKPSKEI